MIKRYVKLFFILTLIINVSTCSSEREEKKEEKKPVSITQPITQPTVNETISTVNQTEEKKEEKVNITEKDRELYEKFAKYPWELLKDREFKSIYIKSLGELSNIPWIRNISGVGGKNKIVKINGKRYVYISFCKPHMCDTEMVYLIYSPDDKRLFGVYLIESDNDFVKVPIGNPSEEDLNILAEAVRKDINSFITPEIILSAKTLPAEELGIKKLRVCPVLRKVEFVQGDNEKVKDLAKLLLNKFLKDENINLDQLKKLNITIEPKNLLLGIVDLNGDRRPDVFMIVNSYYMCGTAGCGAFVYINRGKNRYKSVDVSVFIQNLNYFYLAKTKTRGYRDLIVDDEIILKYNGQKYVNGGKCYVK